MNAAQADERFDTLAAQVHEWVESAVALDEGHFSRTTKVRTTSAKT